MDFKSYGLKRLQSSIYPDSSLHCRQSHSSLDFSSSIYKLIFIRCSLRSLPVWKHDGFKCKITHIYIKWALTAYSLFVILSMLNYIHRKNFHSLQSTYIHKLIHNMAGNFKFIPRYYLSGKVFFLLQMSYKPPETFKVTVSSWISLYPLSPYPTDTSWTMLFRLHFQVT